MEAQVSCVCDGDSLISSVGTVCRYSFFYLSKAFIKHTQHFDLAMQTFILAGNANLKFLQPTSSINSMRYKRKLASAYGSLPT